MIIFPLSFLMLSFIGLYFGAKLVIIGLENISNRYGLSHLMVGLTILAIGTSLPEIAVSIIGALDKVAGISQNVDGIVIGNKVGSFIGNITLILGILGLYQSIFVSKWVLKREGPMLFISLIVFLLCAMDGLITRIEAIIMIIIYFSYLLLIIKSEKRIERLEKKEVFYEKTDLEQECFEPIECLVQNTTMKQDIGIFSIGLVILLVAAEITILSAIELGKEMNLPSNVIGILIVGVGTSLPELTADLTALRRRSHGIAVGDILGSNICDILLATGTGALITDFKVATVIILFDIPIMFLALCICYYFLWSDNRIKKWEAAFLVIFFGVYAVVKLLFFQI